MSNRAAIYARYSSNLQSDLSLEAQVSEMESFCRREKLEVTHRFLLPETRSALVEKTEEFQAMIKAARRGEFEVLVVHKLDRFTRSRDTAVTYKALLRRHNVQVRSVTENLGDSVYDRLIEGILEVFNEFYPLNLAAETRKGQRAATRAGRWTGGKAPFGYQVKKLTDGSILTPCPVTAPVLREVFFRYVQGQGTQAILEFVEQATGERWSYPTLLNRLRNPTYVGRLEYGRSSLDAHGRRTTHDRENITHGTCEALIEPELWDKAQHRLGEYKKRRRKPTYPYLLTEGTMSCEACGRPVVGACRGRDNLPYYLCSGWRDKLCPSKHRSVRADVLDELFTDMIRDTLPGLDTRTLSVAVEKMLASRRSEALEVERELQRKLKALSDQKGKLIDFIMEVGGSSAETVNRKLKDLEAEEGALAERLAKARLEVEERALGVVEAVQGWFEELVESLKGGPQDPAWKAAIRSLFRVSWNWEAKTGKVFLVPLFEETKKEGEAEKPLPLALHLEGGRIGYDRSAQI